MKSYRKRTIRTRLFTLIISILLLGIIINSILNILNFKRSYEDALKEKMVVIAHGINHHVHIGLKYFPLNGFAGMTKILENITETNDDVKYCFISDDTGTILYHSDKSLINTTLESEKYNDINFTNETDKEIIELGRYYEVIIPTFWLGSLVGNIHIGLEKKIITDKIRGMIYQSIFIFFIILFLSVSIYFFILPRIIIKPIDELSRAFKNIVETKDLNQKVILNRQDELGELAESFNKMIENLNITTISRDYFDNIIESIPDIIVVTDGNAIIKMVNNYTTKISGYSEDELIGKKITKLIPKFENQEFFSRDKFKKFITEGYIKNLNIDIQTKQGEKVPASLTGSIITNEKKKTHGIVLVATDLREIQKLIKNLKSYKEDLEEKNERLARFNKLTVGRELEMIKLKEEINFLLEEKGEKPRFTIPETGAKHDKTED